LIHIGLNLLLSIFVVDCQFELRARMWGKWDMYIFTLPVTLSSRSFSPCRETERAASHQAETSHTRLESPDSSSRVSSRRRNPCHLRSTSSSSLKVNSPGDSPISLPPPLCLLCSGVDTCHRANPSRHPDTYLSVGIVCSFSIRSVKLSGVHIEH
jgi:hypothetical protein